MRPTNLEAVKTAPVGSVLTCGDSDWAGDAYRFCVSELRRGHEAILVGTLSPTIALSSGEAELVAALSGACEGMSLRQQWNWLLKFGCNAEETTGAVIPLQRWV